ncbi:MAG: hypothetical protein R3F49_08875 [Planctomycetota bacterium]
MRSTAKATPTHPESAYPGYEVGPDKKNLIWTPGATHSTRPHQSASFERDRWTPDPGYEFSPPNSPLVTWQPGARNPSRAHVSAGQIEGEWILDPGYVIDSRGLPKWTPGRPHRTDPDLVAGAREGSWVTAAKRTPKGDVAQSPGAAQEAQAAASPAQADPSWALTEWSLGEAMRLHADVLSERRAAGEQRADLIRELTLQRDQEMQAAVASALPAEDPAARRAVVDLALRGMDSGFSGWTALGSDRSGAALREVRSQCSSVSDVDRAAELFIRVRRAATRATGQPGSVR